MSSLIMYQFENVQDENEVSKIFKEYCPANVEKFGGCLFLASELAPDFCKLIGFSSINNPLELEQIADFISNADYEKKMEKFYLKSGKMHSKLVSAKKIAKESSANIGTEKFVNTKDVEKIVSFAEKQQKAIEENPKVVKAQCKLGSFLDKNKIYSKSAQFASEKDTEKAIVWDSGIKPKNIYEATEAARQQSKAEFIESALKRLKEFLADLLKVSNKVGLMPITDGNKTTRQISNKTIKLDQLTAADLMNSKNREIIYVTK